jgi:pilus assembly protein CpaF
LSITELCGVREEEIVLHEIFRFEEERGDAGEVRGALRRVGTLLGTEKCLRAGFEVPCGGMEER